MTGSVYFTDGSSTVGLNTVTVEEELVKNLIKIERGMSTNKAAVSGAIVIIQDFKKQTKMYLVNGKIQSVVGGSTAWQQKKELSTIIEAGGTFQFHNGSDGTMTGNASKFKFKEIGGIPNVYDATVEFICGSSKT